MLALDGRNAGVHVASLAVQTGGPAEVQIECDVTDEVSIKAAIDRVMRVNLRGAFLTMQCAGRAIRDTDDGGALVATASSAGVVADLGMVRVAARTRHRRNARHLVQKPLNERGER